MNTPSASGKAIFIKGKSKINARFRTVMANGREAGRWDSGGDHVSLHGDGNILISKLGGESMGMYVFLCIPAQHYAAAQPTLYTQGRVEVGLQL